MSKPPNWVGVEMLSIDDGGAAARVGIQFVDESGSKRGALVNAAPGDLAHIARTLLFSGEDFHNAGAALEGSGSDMPLPIYCNQMVVHSTGPTDTVLLLRFGCMQLPVKLNTQDVRRALGVFDIGASAGLMPESKGH
jgi:hypothetical protein